MTDSTVTRSLTIDLFADGRQAILNSIRRYRAGCRELYAALLLGQIAGAEILATDDSIHLKPSSDAAKLALAAAVGAARITKGEKVRGQGQEYSVRVGSGLAYELRAWWFEQLYPDSLSFVWDSARRDVTVVWKAGDPEHPQASRGWLAMQGARGVAQFQRRGIGFPVATARPKLAAHMLTLKWDKVIGEIDFRIGTLDPGRWRVWKSLYEGAGHWKLGTVFLNERDGQLRATLSYSYPALAAAVDPARELCATFGAAAETFLMLSGPDGGEPVTLSAEGALGGLNEVLARKIRMEARKASCGNPNRPWGDRPLYRHQQELLSETTRHRAALETDWNHAWTRRIVDRARSLCCGRLVLAPLPADLFGHPWAWSSFMEKVLYKAQEAGIVVVVLDEQ